MQEERERREPDPTRKLLKIFGVKVTDYEERGRRLLERASEAGAGTERTALVAEALELTADLNKWLREITSHVLETESRLLSDLQRRVAPPA